MTLRNTEFRITFSSKSGRLHYYFAKDANGWYQVTAAGNRHQATAEQVLNHVLPALAEIEPGARSQYGLHRGRLSERVIRLSLYQTQPSEKSLARVSRTRSGRKGCSVVPGES